MALQAHLVELERKHKILENELHEALVHLSTDDLQIVELKRRKLMVKDEIERLKHTADENSPLVDPPSRVRTILPRRRMGAVALIRRKCRCCNHSRHSEFADMVGDRERRRQSG